MYVARHGGSTNPFFFSFFKKMYLFLYSRNREVEHIFAKRMSAKWVSDHILSKAGFLLQPYSWLFQIQHKNI